MPHDVRLSKVLEKAGWKVKVFDNEGAEEPHYTIMRKTQRWRVSLRTGHFLVPPGGGWNDIPEQVKAAIHAGNELERMRQYWDARNPHNPVKGAEADEQNDE